MAALGMMPHISGGLQSSIPLKQTRDVDQIIAADEKRVSIATVLNAVFVMAIKMSEGHSAILTCTPRRNVSARCRCKAI